MAIYAAALNSSDQFVFLVTSMSLYLHLHSHREPDSSAASVSGAKPMCRTELGLCKFTYLESILRVSNLLSAYWSHSREEKSGGGGARPYNKRGEKTSYKLILMIRWRLQTEIKRISLLLHVIVK